MQMHHETFSGKIKFPFHKNILVWRNFGQCVLTVTFRIFKQVTEAKKCFFFLRNFAYREFASHKSYNRNSNSYFCHTICEIPWSNTKHTWPRIQRTSFGPNIAGRLLNPTVTGYRKMWQKVKFDNNLQKSIYELTPNSYANC